MKEIKVIFFDVDGTLVDHSRHMNTPRESTLQIFRSLKEKGIRIVAASGRTPTSVGNVMDYPFDGFISANGALNYAHNQKIYTGGFSALEVRFLWDYFIKYKIGFVLQGEAVFVYHSLQDYGVDKVVERVKQHNDHRRVIQSDGQNLNEIILKATAFFPTIELSEQTECDFKDKFNIMFFTHNSNNTSEDHLASEISSLRDTKGTGIAHLLDYWKLKPENAIAFGDNLNDIDMFKLVDGYAMENAVQQLKDVATEVIGSVDSDAISEQIQRIGLID